MMEVAELISIFVLFFAVIDPVGTVPVFIAVTAPFSTKDKRIVALKAFVIATCVLIFFVLVGEIILDAIDIPLAAFEVAGGLVLLLFALSMIFGESKPEAEIKNELSTTDKAIFPLAMPSIASPGAILAAVMATENSKYAVLQQFEITLVMVFVLLIVLILMLCSSFVSRIIGRAGASIISRVMGLILSSVAVSSMLGGIKHYFSL